VEASVAPMPPPEADESPAEEAKEPAPHPEPVPPSDRRPSSAKQAACVKRLHADESPAEEAKEPAPPANRVPPSDRRPSFAKEVDEVHVEEAREPAPSAERRPSMGHQATEDLELFAAEDAAPPDMLSESAASQAAVGEDPLAGPSVETATEEVPDVSALISLPLEFDKHRPVKAPIGLPVPKQEVDECMRWEVSLTKDDPSQRYGFSHVREEMMTNLQAEALFVRRVFDVGLVPQWNLEHPDASVQPTDRIISVNGVTVPKDMQSELRKTSAHIIFLRYPERFLVNFAAGECGGRMGMGIYAVLPPEFETSLKKQLLKIKKITPNGPLDQWNQRQIAQKKWQFVVSPGMYIEAVNQVVGDAEALMRELERCIPAAPIEMRLKRSELARCAIEKCRKRAFVLFQWRRSLNDKTAGSSQPPLPPGSSSGSNRRPEARPALPGTVTDEEQESPAMKMAKVLSKEEAEKKEEKDWATAMEHLQKLNNLRGSARSKKDITEGAAGVAIQDFCQVWDMLLQKTAETPRLGFAFTNGMQEFQKARRELAHAMQGPQTLLIKKLADDGAAAVWNKAHPSLELLPCDHINAVNGVDSIEGIKEALRKQKQVRVQVMRYPQHFFVDLRRGLAGAPASAIPALGMKYEACANSANEVSIQELLVVNVDQRGLVERWNQRNIAQGLYQFVVTPGMRIQAVDGVEGSAAAMVEELRSGRARRLRIRRADVGAMARAKVTRTMKALRNMGMLNAGEGRPLTPSH